MPQALVDQHIVSSIELAIDWAGNAVRGLDALVAGTATEHQTAALEANYGPNLRPGNIRFLHTRFRQILRRLRRTLDNNLVVCNDRDSPEYCGRRGWCAFTTCPTVNEAAHLCPSAFDDASCVEPNLASIQLHEAGRAVGLCEDCVQWASPAYPPTRPAAAVANICAYAAFAADYRLI